jgi:hypothetical protein
VDAHDELALVAASIGEDPDRLVRFARRRLQNSGVTTSELAAALRALCRRSVKLEVSSPTRPLAATTPRGPSSSKVSKTSGPNEPSEPEKDAG